MGYWIRQLRRHESVAAAVRFTPVRVVAGEAGWSRWSRELYQVEHAIAHETVDLRRASRLAESVPILHWIERDAVADTVLPKSPLGDAVRHLTNWLSALQRFVETTASGSTTTAPRISCRPWAARNWLFAASRGQRARRSWYSLVQSRTLIDVPPFENLNACC